MNEEYAESIKLRIKDLLVDLYGKASAEEYYGYLLEKTEEYQKSRTAGQIQASEAIDPDHPWSQLAGKVFTIAYPDNISAPGEYTLETLSAVLKSRFPAVKGLHILPEREICHQDVVEQDFYGFAGREKSREYISALHKSGILDSRGVVTDEFELAREKIAAEYPGGVLEVIEKAWNYHFNDGGFSQIRRDRLDPRFGRMKELRAVSEDFSIMLDYVVNHLDIDNPYLEAYRAGQGSGESFIIITADEYENLKKSGGLNKTFRPRPFPLFTGLRKYPEGGRKPLIICAEMMSRLFGEKKIPAPPVSDMLFLSLAYKMRNDQGLTAEDRRALSLFETESAQAGKVYAECFTDSDIHKGQKVLRNDVTSGQLCDSLGWKAAAKKLFLENESAVFGEIFYVYTTFSESQTDIYPKSRAGFHLVIDDLFSILSGGTLAMLRMDAIKYLWKEIGKKNFDMDEGNKLTEIVKLVMRLAAPEVLPLDEVNSPDSTVYSMGSHGGFFYLFGPVNSVSIAFNEQDLGPLRNMQSLMKRMCPPDLLLFVMLSTHDGRSVQGLGLQHRNSHVTIEQFYRFREIIETNGGMAKYRSVPKGIASAELLDNVIEQAGFLDYEERIRALFLQGEDNTFILPEELIDRKEFLERLGEVTKKQLRALEKIPAVDFLCRWICDGKTEYELCATSRSSFRQGSIITPELEAQRLALAQLYIMTMGQHVPAIYFNDLMGIANDREGFAASGKPRDLNRKKLKTESGTIAGADEEFMKYYLPLLNRMIELRAADAAFFPGSSRFEEIILSDKVFIHHAFHGHNDSVVIGNIAMTEQEIDITGELAAILLEEKPAVFTDMLSYKPLKELLSNNDKLTIAPYCAYYLQRK